MVDDELLRRAKALLDQLCDKPRFAGSAGEANARELCQRELQSAGFDCQERPFEFSEWPGRWGPPFSAVIQAATIVFVARMAMVSGPLTALIIGAAIVAALFFVDAYAKRRWITDFPLQRSRSKNLEARRGNPRVWLVAHLDSKAQTLAMVVRIAGSVALMVAMLVTVVFLLLDLTGIAAVESLWHPLQTAAILAAIPGISCFIVEDGDGAVDNASGVVAVVLTAHSAGAPHDLGILISSGEELGLAGARTWSTSAPKEGRFLNCDTVDDFGDWRCMYTGPQPLPIVNAARQLAGRLGMPLRVGRLIPGILADSIAFADRGLTAVTLSRGTLSTLARIHTLRDNSNALAGRGAAEASVLLAALAKELT